ncbi:MAG: hypothetical protein V7775_17965 [Sulfitobacter sp.]
MGQQIIFLQHLAQRETKRAFGGQGAKNLVNTSILNGFAKPHIPKTIAKRWPEKKNGYPV